MLDRFKAQKEDGIESDISMLDQEILLDYYRENQMNLFEFAKKFVG